MQLSKASTQVFKADIESAAEQIGLMKIESTPQHSSFQTADVSKFMTVVISAVNDEVIALFATISAARAFDEVSANNMPLLIAKPHPEMDGKATLEICRPGSTQTEKTEYASFADLLNGILDMAN